MGFSSWPPLWKIFLLVSTVILYLSSRSEVLNYYLKIIGLCFAIPHTAWRISKVIRNYTQMTFISPVNKAVLITGCDSGFGQLAAKALDVYGFHVFAGCLHAQGNGAQRLYKTTSNKLRILSLDITRPEDIAAAVKEIEESGLSLWAVINNAAIADWGPVEWDSASYRIRKIFSVNLYGTIDVTNACLPLLRKTRGRIVNISSVFGRITIGGLVPYCMSKHALKSYTDGLRKELADHDIKVVCIEPLAYQTEMTQQDKIVEDIKVSWKLANDSTKEFYGETSKSEIQNDLSALPKIASYNLREVIDAVEEAVTASNPLEFYRCCNLFHGFVVWLAEQMNEQCLDIFLSKKTIRRVAHILAFKVFTHKSS